MADDKNIVNKEDVGKFMAHEMIRELHDRLINDSDRVNFYKIISDDLHMFLKVLTAFDEFENF